VASAVSGRPLRPRHVRFVREYLVDLNGAQAAIRAGYSPRRADQTAYELLRNREIQAAVSQLIDTLEQPNMLAVEASEQRLADLQGVDILQSALDAAMSVQAKNSLEKMLCYQ
jgi:phage terminase small subunit